MSISSAALEDLRTFQERLGEQVYADGRSHEDIAGAAGVSRTTLHGLIRDRDKLAHARVGTVDRVLNELWPDPAPRRQVRELYMRTRAPTPRRTARTEHSSPVPLGRWLVVGPEGRRHFERRARGHRGVDRSGDLFFGRTAALARLRCWMCDPDPPGVPLVVTGAPGAGKSAVLARGVITLDAEGFGPGLAFHARGATHDELLDALGRLLGLPGAATRQEVLDALAAADAAQPAEGDRLLVAVDALDEVVGSVHDVADTLREIATFVSVRVVVATRRLEPVSQSDLWGDVRAGASRVPAQGTLLAQLAADRDSLVDLDTDRYFDPLGLRQCIEALLATPGPRGRAWQRYRDDGALRTRLARHIARRAGRNHLVAVMAADPLARQQEVLDPCGEDFDPDKIPSTVGAALDYYLEALPPRDRGVRRSTLVALAYAHGEGLDDPLWREFAAALGYTVSQTEIDELRGSAAADYLLQTVSSRADGRRVTRLFHEALADQLLRERDVAADHAALVTLLRPRVAGTGLSVANLYAEDHLVEHAALARVLPSVLRDPDVALNVDLSRLSSLLRGRSARKHAIVLVVRRAAARATMLDPAARAHLFALAAAHLGYDDLRETFAARSRWLYPCWAHLLGAPHEEFADHAGRVDAMTFGHSGDGRALLAVAGAGIVRVWDPAVGADRYVVEKRVAGVRALALGDLADGRSVLVISDGRAVRLWDMDTDTERHTLHGVTHGASALSIGRSGRSRRLLAGLGVGTIRLWDLDTGVRYRLIHYPGVANALAFGLLAGGSLVLAAAGVGAIRFWDPETGVSGPTLLTPDGGAHALAFGHLADGRCVLASAEPRNVSLWEPETATLRHVIRTPGGIASLVFGEAEDGRPVLAGAAGDGAVIVWDAETGTELDQLHGHRGRVRAVGFGRVSPERVVLASAGDDRTIRLWDPLGARTGAAPRKPGGDLRALAYAEVNGRQVLATSSAGRTAQLWNPATGTGMRSVGPHAGEVTALAVGAFRGGTPVLAAASVDEVRLWDADTGSPGHVLKWHPGRVSALAFAALNGGSVLAAAAGDFVQLWNPGTGRRLGAPLENDGPVHALATGRLQNGCRVLAGAGDGSVRLWDMETGEPVYEPFGHTGMGRALAFGWFGDGAAQMLAATSGGTIHLWSVDDGTLRCALSGHTSDVSGLAFGRLDDGSVVLVSIGEDETLRVWDPLVGEELHAARLLMPAGSVACVGHHVVVSVGPALLRLDLDPRLGALRPCEVDEHFRGL